MLSTTKAWLVTWHYNLIRTINQTNTNTDQHYQALDISKQTDMYLRPSIRGKDCSVFSPCKRLTVCPSPWWGSASTHRSQTPSWEPAQRPATHPDTGLLQDTRHDRMHWIIHVLTHRSVRIYPLHTEVRRRPRWEYKSRPDACGSQEKAEVIWEETDGACVALPHRGDWADWVRKGQCRG